MRAGSAAHITPLPDGDPGRSGDLMGWADHAAGLWLAPGVTGAGDRIEIDAKTQGPHGGAV
jgi:hypothetical protein